MNVVFSVRDFRPFKIRWYPGRSEKARPSAKAVSGILNTFCVLMDLSVLKDHIFCFLFLSE